MTAHQPADLGSGAAPDSASSTPRSDHPPPPPSRWHVDDSISSAATPRVRLMCSFGGRILPRPHDNQLRYVGGDTRIVAVARPATFSALLSKLSKLCPTAANPDDVTIKYQLPSEDLDSLISITSDEDVDNMMEEYDRLSLSSSAASTGGGRIPRLRLFIFPSSNSGGGGGEGFGSVLDGPGSGKHERWFLDALNGGRPPLERGRSEVSSIISEVPDYLFGLDANSVDEPLKPKTNWTTSDPGSPAPATSSPHFGSASSPDQPPVKAKPEVVDPPVEPQIQQPGGYVPNPVWQYVPEPVPVYYVPGPVPGGRLPVRQGAMPVQYVHQVQLGPAAGQVPVGYGHPVQGMIGNPVHSGPVYVGGPPGGRPAVAGVYDYPVGPPAVAAEGYEVPAAGGLMRNSSEVIPVYPGAGVASVGGESAAVNGSERRVGRPLQ